MLWNLVFPAVEIALGTAGNKIALRHGEFYAGNHIPNLVAHKQYFNTNSAGQCRKSPGAFYKKSSGSKTARTSIEY